MWASVSLQNGSVPTTISQERGGDYRAMASSQGALSKGKKRGFRFCEVSMELFFIFTTVCEMILICDAHAMLCCILIAINELCLKHGAYSE